MHVQFDRPWLLSLLMLLVICLIWAWRYESRMRQPKKGIVFTLRSLVLVCLVLAIAGMQVGSSTEQLAVLYTIDRSDSMPEEQLLLDWITQAEQYKGAEDLSGIVSFGRQSAIERTLSVEPYDGQRLMSPVDRNFTNIEQGLKTAYGRLLDPASGRIVLLTDGRETSGSLLRQGKFLQYAGVPVDIVPITSNALQDVAVEEVTIPEQLRTGDRYPLGVRLSSTFPTNGVLRIYENNQEIYRGTIEVQSGDNEFVFQSIAGDAGLNRYRVEIYPEGDERSVNNAAFAFSRVMGEPHVLVVSQSEQEQVNVTALLEAASLRYTATSPELLPNDLSGYTTYDSIILNNVSAISISEEKMEWIEQAVRDFGVGFMMTGGDNSFGLGGYFQTPIENALPVYMDLRGERQIPSLGLVLVIDRSGSMQGDKLELAKEAALRTMELMREQDTLGVIAFDSTPWWAVEPQQLTDQEDVKNNILSIQANGGTEIYPAVLEAYERLTDIDAQRKHIILLTDGHSATSQSYEQLAAGMQEEGITLSTVGIGQGADQQSLEQLASLGHGRHYFTDDQSTIPTIFSQEAVLMTRTYIVDEPFVPQLYEGFDWHRLFQSGTPLIHAYVATTPKETAESVLVSLEPDPVLARWQYGAGKSVAWMSDVNGRWSGEWISWLGFVDVFGEMVQWTFPQYETSPLSLSSQLAEDEVVLRVYTQADLFDVKLEGIMSSEGSRDEPQTVRFTPVLPGEFEARVKIDDPGVYMMRIDMKRLDHEGEKRLLGSWTTGFVIPYSPEYSLSMPIPRGVGIRPGSESSENLDNELSTDESSLEPGNIPPALQELAAMTGGRVLTLDQADELFNIQRPIVTESRDITRILLIVALLLWVLDIAARRLSIPWAQSFEKVSGWVFAGRRRRALSRGGTGHYSGRIDQLQQRKQVIAGRIAGDARQLTQATEKSGVSESTRLPLRPTAQGDVNERAIRSTESVTGGRASKLTGDDAVSPAIKGSDVNTEASPAARHEDRLNRLLQAKNRKK